MKKTFVVMILVLFGYCQAFADAPPPPSNASEMTLEQATRQVISSHAGGRILSAKTEEVEGKKIHVIKMLTQDGRIQQQSFAADTGALLNIDNN